MPQPTAPLFQRLSLMQRLRLRRKRQKLLWRAFRSRRNLKAVQNNTSQIKPGDVVLFAVLRNEATRLPSFFDHYRALGVNHFCIVDNASTDETPDILRQQSNVSIWETTASYRDSRFGMDWINRLMMRYGHGRWCVVVDADELLILPSQTGQKLSPLIEALEAAGRVGFGALMLDLCPKGALGSQSFSSDQKPTDILPFFDPGPYRAQRQMPLQNLWVQGGLRERKFFSHAPKKSPTLNKIPLIKWQRRWAFVISTHSVMPPYLNSIYDGPGGDDPSGILLHTKFLPEIVSKSEIEKARRQHFHNPDKFDDYYDQIATQPELWDADCETYQGPEQLEALDLMGIGRGVKKLRFQGQSG